LIAPVARDTTNPPEIRDISSSPPRAFAATAAAAIAPSTCAFAAFAPPGAAR
jgi:hypothetical protein